MAKIFTRTYPGIVKKLLTTVEIESDGKMMQGMALWDTGATCTCISPAVVDRLGLISTGKTILVGATGRGQTDTYLLSLELPNQFRLDDIRVSRAELEKQNFDILIGMDVISQGDFAVSNFNNKTVFSFRIPSEMTIDFCKKARVAQIIGPAHGKGNRKRK